MGSTNQKPSFDKTYSKIELGEDFEKRLGLVHIEIEKLKKKKASIYIYSFLYMVIGCTLILSQRNLLVEFTLTYSSYVITLRSLLVIVVGFGLLGAAYSKLNKYRKQAKILKDKKNKIDAVLNKYQIEYSCRVEFGEKYHGNQDVNVELKSKSNLLKDSKITYQI